MDKKKLIAAVFQRAPIWDKTNKNHHNSVVLARLWREVAQECNQPSMATVKGQWKRLRESFMKKLKEACEDGEEPDWPYYQSLRFLKDQCTPKQLPGSSSDWDTVSYSFEDSSQRMDEIQCKSEFLEDSFEPDSISHRLSPLHSTSSPMLSPRITSSVSRSKMNMATVKMDHSAEVLLNTEQVKLEYLERKEECEVDEDASFFNSILPHVRALNAKKKIKFRIQVLQLLDNELPSASNLEEFLNN